MRQVDRDELTYALFAATRGWPASSRRAIFEQRRRDEVRRKIIAEQISDKLGLYTFVDAQGAALERGARAELFDRTIAAFPGAIGKLWLSPQPERQDDARRAAAVLLYRALEPYEVLTDAPYGETLFFREITAPTYAFAPTWP